MLAEMDRILREIAKPVAKETWTPLVKITGMQICACCWDTIFPGPAKSGNVAAWRRTEGAIYECCACRDQAR
jgi:hypothetical protein